jgi:Protein of unknown function (DUF5672)
MSSDLFLVSLTPETNSCDSNNVRKGSPLPKNATPYIHQHMTVDTDAAIIKAVFDDVASRPYKNEGEFLNACRHTLDPYVFGSLRARYGPTFQAHWDTCSIPSNSDRTIVLVERRCHPNLPFCLQNAVYYAKGWGLTIVCSRQNRAFVDACLGHQRNSVRVIVQWDTEATPEDGKKEYNMLLQTAAFWRLFTESHLLMMETDTYLRRPIPDSILQYDYVASKWPWKASAPGGGGLSYRKRAVMERICSIGLPLQYAQDCFISDAIEGMKCMYPSYESARAYFVEFEPTPMCCGTHQWWTGLRSYSLDMIKMMLTCSGH